MTHKYSDNDQLNFEMAVDKLYATVSRLRDVTQGDNWDETLSKAWLEFQTAVNDAIPAYSYL